MTSTKTLPWTHGGLQRPQTPAELSNRDLTQMRIGGQRTAFEIHHCTNARIYRLLLLAPFGVNLSLTSISFVLD